MPFELILEVTAPAFGQCLDLHSAPHSFQIISFKRIQTNDVGNANAILITTEPLDRISSLNHAFSQNCKIESAPSADEKPFQYVSPSQFIPELVAMYSGLCVQDFLASTAKAF